MLVKEVKKQARNALHLSAQPKGPPALIKHCPPTMRRNDVRRNDVSSVNPSNQSVKLSKPPNPVSAYDDQITELKLNVDSLEKERDFYFTKLRDIETLCQSRKIENLMVVGPIKRILYATDDDESVVTEAKAMVSLQQNEAEVSSSAAEVSEEKMNYDANKKKNTVNLDVDAVGITTLSPKAKAFGCY